MDEEWAYICAPETWPSRLYHLPEDPDQLQDVAGEHPEIADKMRAALLAFMREMGAPPERMAKFQ